MTTELITMFFTRYLRRGSLANTSVPLSLIPPDITLTTEQQFFAGGNYLEAFDNAGNECSVNLTWETPEGSGTITEP